MTMSFWPRTRSVTLGRPTLIRLAGTNSSASSESAFESDDDCECPALLAFCSPNLFRCCSFNLDSRFFCFKFNFLLSSGDRCKLIFAIFISLRNFSGSGHGRRCGRTISAVISSVAAADGAGKIFATVSEIGFGSSLTGASISCGSLSLRLILPRRLDIPCFGLRSMSLSKFSLLSDKRALFCSSNPCRSSSLAKIFGVGLIRRESRCWG